MKPNPVYFESTRWPGAKLEVAPHPDDKELIPRIGIGVSGTGRRWVANTSLGFWRSFPEIQITDEAIDWVRRYGNPLEHLGGDRRIIFTDGWNDLAEVFSRAASLWDAPGEDGVSRFNRRHIGKPIEINSPPMTINFNSMTGFRIVIKSLGTFMLMSAVELDAAQSADAPLRGLRSLVRASRNTGRVCSSRCQQIKSSREKGGRDGIGPEEEAARRRGQMAGGLVDKDQRKPASQRRPSPRRRKPRYYAAEMTETIERNGIGDPARQTVRSYLHSWLDHLEKRGQHSITTLPGYRLNIERACRFIGDIPLARLTSRDIDFCYVDLLARGGWTQKRDASGRRLPQPLLCPHRSSRPPVPVISVQAGGQMRLIAENPCDHASPPKPGKAATRALTQSEVAKVLDTAAAAGFYPGIDVFAQLSRSAASAVRGVGARVGLR